MMRTQKIQNLRCEQVYSIWATEPDLIRVLDVRPKDEFSQSHIPGSMHLSPELVPSVLTEIGDRLAIIVAHEDLERDLAALLIERENFVFMSQCQRWIEMNNPLAGDGLKRTVLNFDKEKGDTMNKDIIFHQLFEPESSTYTYIIADKKTKQAAIIDPVLETVDRDLKLINELGLNLQYVLDTHIHADHITGAGEIRKRTSAKTAVSQNANVDCVDIPLEDGQELLLGDKKITVISTPGHTNTCLTYAFEGAIFTGDALLIRGCGRTDFQQGSSDKLFESVREKLFKLPDETVIYPGHDYRGFTSSTVGLEKAHNPRLNLSISKDEFKRIMSELKLANPKKIHEAVPANLACGTPKDSRVMHPQMVDGIPEISVEEIHNHQADVEANKLMLIDVRRPDEFNNELGHIKGAKLVTLGPELDAFLEKGDRNKEIAFVCRSGARSGNATIQSQQLGYKLTANMVGGMLRWNEKKLPTEKK